MQTLRIFLAGWKGQRTNNEPIRFDAFPSKPKISFQETKIQLPNDFGSELDKIENFYDLYLQEIVPILVGEGNTEGLVTEKPRKANRSKLVG